MNHEGVCEVLEKCTTQANFRFIAWHSYQNMIFGDIFYQLPLLHRSLLSADQLEEQHQFFEAWFTFQGFQVCASSIRWPPEISDVLPSPPAVLELLGRVYKLLWTEVWQEKHRTVRQLDVLPEHAEIAANFLYRRGFATRCVQWRTDKCDVYVSIDDMSSPAFSLMLPIHQKKQRASQVLGLFLPTDVVLHVILPYIVL